MICLKHISTGSWNNHLGPPEPRKYVKELPKSFELELTKSLYVAHFAESSMYATMYIYYIHTYIYISYICTHTHPSTNIFIYTSTYTYMYTCMRAYIHVFAYMFTSIQILSVHCGPSSA